MAKRRANHAGRLVNTGSNRKAVSDVRMPPSMITAGPVRLMDRGRNGATNTMASDCVAALSPMIVPSTPFSCITSDSSGRLSP